MSVDVPDNPDRVFLIDELLEIYSAEEDVHNNTEEPPSSKGQGIIEPVPLPNYYNITFIEVMVRDPFWAFVFWEIKTSEKEQLENSPDFGAYYLKVTPLDNLNNSSSDEAEGVFTVQVKPEDNSRYLGLTPDQIEGVSRSDHSQYKVELCVNLADSEVVLATSNPILLPGLPELPNRSRKQGAKPAENSGRKSNSGGSNFSENQLVRLSGYGDFRILHRNERQFRAKGGGSAADSNERT